MFLEYYGLREQPFGVTPDPRYLYFSASHREALASLFYGIETGCGFLALIAPPGMGKTTLLLHLLERLRGSAQTVFLFQTQCSSRELFRYLLTDLGIDASDQNLARMHESLNAVLLNNARAQRRFVLVIDEAQNLDDSVLETIRLLSDFETPQAKLMQIVLCGQPQLADKLAQPALMQLRQRISIVGRLHPFTIVETMVYIDYRLHQAGYAGPALFTYDAIAEVSAHSGGIPRIINNICFNVLTLGYAKRRTQIDAAVVREVIADLDLEGLGSRRGNVAMGPWDSLFSFDGMAPTDEASYQEFHAALRVAWGDTPQRINGGQCGHSSGPTGEGDSAAHSRVVASPSPFELPHDAPATTPRNLETLLGSVLCPPTFPVPETQVSHRIQGVANERLESDPPPAVQALGHTSAPESAQLKVGTPPIPARIEKQAPAEAVNTSAENLRSGGMAVGKEKLNSKTKISMRVSTPLLFNYSTTPLWNSAMLMMKWLAKSAQQIWRQRLNGSSPASEVGRPAIVMAASNGAGKDEHLT